MSTEFEELGPKRLETSMLKIHQRSLPDLKAWGITIFSVVLTLTLATLSFICALEFRQKISKNRLQLALKEGRYSYAQERLQKATEVTGLEMIVFKKGHQIRNKEQGYLYGKQLIDTLDHLSRNEYENANSVYEQLDSQILTDLLLRISTDSKVVDFSLILKKNLDFLTENSQKRRSLEDTLLLTQSEISDTREKYKDASYALAGIMSLTPAYGPELEAPEKIFYKDGIFKDLPVILNIPDKIETLDEFRNHLEAARGEIRLEAADARKELLNRLEKLRGKSLTVRYSGEQLLHREAQALRALAVLRKKMDASQKALEGRLISAITLIGRGKPLLRA